MLIQDRLKNTNSFSDTEKSIVDYFLKVQLDIKKENVRHIAEHTYTSPSSVLRVCQKIGFEGFVDFKEAYVKEIKYLSSHFQNVDANIPFSPNDKNTIIANKIGTLYEETIRDTLSLIHHDTLQQAANMLERAQTIYICASGVSQSLVCVFKDNMVKIGKTVISFEYTGDAFYEACYRDENACFIIVSYSGETTQVVRIAKKLKERQIPSIAITSYGNSTVADHCDCHLCISTRQKLISNLGNFSINLSILYLLDVLYANCFHFHYDEYLENKVKFSKELENERKSSNPILKENHK